MTGSFLAGSASGYPPWHLSVGNLRPGESQGVHHLNLEHRKLQFVLFPPFCPCLRVTSTWSAANPRVPGPRPSAPIRRCAPLRTAPTPGCQLVIWHAWTLSASSS